MPKLNKEQDLTIKMTWPTAEEAARSPSPQQFISRQLSSIDYEEEDPEAEALETDLPLIRVPLHRTNLQPANLEEPTAVHEKYEEEENPLDLEEIVSKQVELSHGEQKDWKGEEIIEDLAAETEPFAPKELAQNRGGVSFILGGTVIPKNELKQPKKLTQDALFCEEAQMYDVDHHAAERD